MLAEKVSDIHPLTETKICSATVLSIDEQGYQIAGLDGEFLAKRAFTCLVEPMAGDKILFSIDTGLDCHVLSIIERPDSVDTQLVFPGNVTMNASQGQLNLNGQQGVNISSAQSINQSAQEYNLIADKALLCIDSFNFVGSKLVAKIKNLQTYADTLETVAGNLLQKLKNSFRIIEGVDQSKCKDAIHTVDNLYSMQTKQAAILAKKDIKMDAERIHMG